MLYLDCIFVTFMTLIPSLSYNSVDSMSLNIVFLLIMLCYYTDHIGQVIFISVMHCILRFIVSTHVYNAALTVESVFKDLIYIISLLVFNLIFATLFAYLASLQERMRSTILQNAKLLNGMHEGLLILSKLDKSILFVNRPAQKLLKNIIDFSQKQTVPN